MICKKIDGVEISTLPNKYTSTEATVYFLKFPHVSKMKKISPEIINKILSKV